MLIASSSLISSAKNLAVNPVMRPHGSFWQATAKLFQMPFVAVKHNSPSQVECDQAIELLNMAINEVDQATLAAIISKLTSSSQ
eukprot:m.231728 g.231728  ORF g.231728 m.231728 type:complete len:84 (+) comp40074_c1_seq5:4939-5190(+)